LQPIWRAFRALVTVGVVLAAVPAGAAAQQGGSGPRITRPPALSASSQVGQRLDATGATWTGRPPVRASWVWLRCDDDSLWSCEFINAPDQPSYTLTAADVGKRLRVLLIVSDRDDRAYSWSSATPVISAPAPPAPPAPPAVPVPAPPPVTAPAPATPDLVPDTTSPAAKLMSPAPLVRIQGFLTPGGAMITRLTVRAPRGVTISVRCFGRGCERRALTRAAAVVRRAKVTRLKSFEGRVRAGTRFVIRVTKPGAIGKHTVIRIRRGKQPARRDRCLYPGSRKPVACPAG
jgi:hypothetical protein